MREGAGGGEAVAGRSGGGRVSRRWWTQVSSRSVSRGASLRRGGGGIRSVGHMEVGGEATAEGPHTGSALWYESYLRQAVWMRGVVGMWWWWWVW